VFAFFKFLRGSRHSHSSLYKTQKSPPGTYGHRNKKARVPVRSLIDKLVIGGLVVGWVTTSESPLLYVFAFFKFLRGSRHSHSSLYKTQKSPPGTYGHRIKRTRVPVRSLLYKLDIGGLVVGWVTTSESPLLYVFAFFGEVRNPFFMALFGVFMTHSTEYMQIWMHPPFPESNHVYLFQGCALFINEDPSGNTLRN
jgi:hypothetical protein